MLDKAKPGKTNPKTLNQSAGASNVRSMADNPPVPLTMKTLVEELKQLKKEMTHKFTTLRNVIGACPDLLSIDFVSSSYHYQ